MLEDIGPPSTAKSKCSPILEQAGNYYHEIALSIAVFNASVWNHHSHLADVPTKHSKDDEVCQVLYISGFSEVSVNGGKKTVPNATKDNRIADLEGTLLVQPLLKQESLNHPRQVAV